MVVVEVKGTTRISSLDLSVTIARLAEAREAVGAEFGLLVVADERELVGAVGQPLTAITTMDRLRDDLGALLERLERR